MRSYEYGCDWPVALSLPTGEDWDSGLYLATFSIPGTRARTRVPFVVKGAADSRAPRLMALNFTTYQAYNYWGGRSLYGAIDRSGQRDWNEGHRSTRVSFNRPFSSTGPGPVRTTTTLRSFHSSNGWSETISMSTFARMSIFMKAPDLLSDYKLLIIVESEACRVWGCGL